MTPDTPTTPEKTPAHREFETLQDCLNALLQSPNREMRALGEVLEYTLNHEYDLDESMYADEEDEAPELDEAGQEVPPRGNWFTRLLGF